MLPIISGYAARWSRLLLLSFLLLPLISTPLHAKTVGLTAIEIYPGNDGQAYLQIADFILNGKNEVYLCTGAAGVDKSSYHKLVKVQLTTGMSLERDAKGVLMLTRGTETACIVPGNIKYDKDAAYTASELADKAAVEGRIVSSSDPSMLQIAPLKPGVKLVFVAVPDQELAEFLRAERAGDINGWKGYLEKNPAGSHATTAKKSLASLYAQVGNTDLQAYQSSKGGPAPNYSKLQESRQMEELARAQVSDDAAVTDLNQKVHAEVLTLSSAAKETLDLYLQAVKTQTPGYAKLLTAEKLADAAFSVEPFTHEAAEMEAQSKSARNAFDRTLRECEEQIAAQHADEAAQKISSFQGFAKENPKVSDDLQAISTLYVVHAEKLDEASDYSGEIKDLEKALAIVPSPDTQALLKAAKEKDLTAMTKGAATAAMQKSQEAEDNKDLIGAYEVLDNLPPDQRALVTERLDALKSKYVAAAQQAAKGLQKAYDPINGPGDEVGIQTAYGYLQRCYRITNEPALQDRITILGDDLSAYYLQQGKKYAEKPDGTGVNIGWTYLTEALQYKSPSSLGAIHDEMTTVRAAHLLKSRLSVKVDFRDQTSRRQAVDFAVQLTDSIATGLESSGLGVKVIRPQEATAVQPNFQMVGDVLRHEMSKSQETIAKDSEYRSGTTEVPNEEWNRANRDYERANMDLQSARSVLEGVEAHGKKGQIKDAKKVVEEDEKKVDEVHAKLDMIPKTSPQDVVRPYTYTQVIYHLKVIVELQFRILDGAGNEVVQRIPIKRETSRDYSVLQNVKPDDTKGVRAEGVIPNDNDVFEDDEYRARDELIEKAKAKVAELPGILLSTADRKAADGDNDGAAELYILYLNSTPATDTPERTRVLKFLVDQFNFKDFGRDVASQ